MRFKYGCVGALGVLMAGGPASAHADDAATRKALDAQYAKISQAYKTKSLKPLHEVTAPDFVMMVPGGKSITRQQAEQQFQTSLSFIKSVTSAKEKINKVTVKGNEATVDAQESIEGVTADMQSQGKAHTMGVTNQNRDTWVKTGNIWLRKSSTMLKGTMTADGKKMDLNELFKKMGPPVGAKGPAPMKK